MAKAKDFIGTPWRHQGRDRSGVDCVGLIVAMGYEFDMVPEGFWLPAYRREPDASLLGYFDKYMTPASRMDPPLGCAVIFAFGGSPYHAGILIDRERRVIVHASAPHKKVVVGALDNNRKGRVFIRAYDFPGVTDG